MDCPQTEPLSQVGFFERIKASGKRIPLSGSLELTMRCNMRCIHCYLGDNRKGSSQQEMTTEQIFNILDQVTDAGTLWFLLTGGEPLLRPDFFDIYNYAVRKGLLVTLFTNGTLLTKSIASRLADLPPQKIEITLYGATRETYEKVTGISGSYDQCRRGIENILAHNLPLALKTVAIKANQHEVEEMKAFTESLGLKFRYDPMMVGSLDGNQNGMKQRLSPEEIVQLDSAEPDRLKEWKDFYKNKIDQPTTLNRVYMCGAGRDTYHIDPSGHLTPCILSRSQWYNILEGSFSEAWDQFLEKIISQPARQDSPCSTCNLIPFCGQCPGKASLEGGQIDERIDYFCQVGHLRSAAFRDY